MKKVCTWLLVICMVLACITGCTNGTKPEDSQQTGTTNNASNGNTGIESSNGTEQGSTKPKTITMATTVAWNSICPFTSTGRTYTMIYRAIYGNYVYFDGENKIQPLLVKSWDISEDGLVYTLHLDENATWQDGEPVTADDVVFSTELATNPAVPTNTLRSQNAYIVGCDATGAYVGPDPLGVVALDAHTVQVSLTTPVGENILFTSLPYLLPKHLLEKEDPATLDTWEFWNKPVGSGPWKLVDSIIGESATFAKNETYFAGAPKFDTLIYKVFASSDLLPGLMSGEIDILAGNSCCALPLTDYDMAVGQSNLTVATLRLGKYVYIPIDMDREYLQDVRVRQAFELAIDKQFILDSVNLGLGEVIASPYNSTCDLIDPSLQSEYNPEKAKKLLEEAGWDFDRVLKLAVNPEKEPAYSQTPILLQQMLADVGVKTELVSVDYQTMMAKMAEGGHYDLTVMGGSCDTKRPYFLSSQYNPSVFWNWSHIKDTKFLDKLTSTLYMTDKEDIKAAYREFQQMQLDDPQLIWVCELDEVIVYNHDRLSNITLPASTDVEWTTWLWDVK